MSTNVSSQPSLDSTLDGLQKVLANPRCEKQLRNRIVSDLEALAVEGRLDQPGIDLLLANIEASPVRCSYEAPHNRLLARGATELPAGRNVVHLLCHVTVDLVAYRLRALGCDEHRRGHPLTGGLISAARVLS